MISGSTKLHIFQGGSITVRKYVEEVFQLQFKLFRGTDTPDFIVMNDNARPCRTYVISEYLHADNIIQMD